MPSSDSADLEISASPAWLRHAGLVLVLGVAAVLVWLHALVLAPFALSLALAYVLKPAVVWMVAKGLPRAAAAAVALLAAVLLGTLLFLLLVPIVADLAPMLRAQLPDLAARGWAAAAPWLNQLGLKVPGELSELRPMLVELFNTHGEQWARTALSSLRVGGSLLLTLSGLAFLVPVLAFYWLLDWDRLMAGAASLVPLRWRPNVGSVAAEADDLLGQYLRGQLLVMLILAAFYSIGLSLFGFDLALPIGVFTGLAVFIPYLGFGLGLILAILAGLLQFAADPHGLWWPVIAVTVVYGVGQFVESLFLTPRLVGERIGLNPIGVIFALMLFGQWMGFAGVLIALPASALAMVLLRRGVRAWRASRYFRRPAAPDAA